MYVKIYLYFPIKNISKGALIFLGIMVFYVALKSTTINIYQIHTDKNVYHRKEKGFFNKSEGIPKTKQFTLIYFQTLCFESLHPSVKILKSKIYVSLFSVILQSRYRSSKNKY